MLLCLDRLLLEHSVDGAFVLAFLDGLTFVVLLFTSSDRDDQLGKSALIDKEAQGHYRDTWLLYILGNAANFFAVKQEFAVAVGHVVVVGAEAVLGNIHVLDPYLAVNHSAIGIS